MEKSHPWFKTWFDTLHYHKLYAHHNEKAAAIFIDALIGILQPASGATMLDVGCGTGRHCKRLGEKGFQVMGIDLSQYSIRQARKFETQGVRFFQHDMRQPYGSNRFDFIFNFFTSFGYFKKQRENHKVISNMSNALKRTGTLVLDYMNIHYVEDRLIEKELKEIDGIIYHISRWMDEQYSFKKIVIDHLQTGAPLEYVEQVSRFDLDDFSRMFRANRLSIKEVFGDYELNEFNVNNSPRLIMVVDKIE